MQPNWDKCQQTDNIEVDSRATQTERSGLQLFSVNTFNDEGLHFYPGLETHGKFRLVLQTL